MKPSDRLEEIARAYDKDVPGTPSWRHHWSALKDYLDEIYAADVAAQETPFMRRARATLHAGATCMLTGAERATIDCARCSGGSGGHTCGEQALRIVAERLRRETLEEGMIGTMGNGADAVIGHAPSIAQLRADIEKIGGIYIEDTRGSADQLGGLDGMPKEFARLRSALNELAAWRERG